MRDVIQMRTTLNVDDDVLRAVKEIARQLRLRDLGGGVVRQRGDDDVDDGAVALFHHLDIDVDN